MKGGAEKLDYNAPASLMVFGPKQFKDPIGGSYVQPLGPTIPDDIGIGPLPEGLEKRFNLSPEHQKYIDEQRKLREHPGGIGSDAATQAKADRRAAQDTPQDRGDRTENQNVSKTSDQELHRRDVKQARQPTKIPQIRNHSDHDVLWHRHHAPSNAEQDAPPSSKDQDTSKGSSDGDATSENHDPNLDS